MTTKLILDHDIKAVTNTIGNMEKQLQIMESTVVSFKQSVSFIKELANEIHQEVRPHLEDPPKKENNVPIHSTPDSTEN